MKKTTLLLLAALAMLAPAGASAQSFSASLTGAAEVPGPGDTDGSGFAVIAISGTNVTYILGANNIAAPNAAHIHRGSATESGPVVVDLAPAFIALSSSGTVPAAQAILDEIRANPAGFYVNIHNADFPDGAIRGQLASPAGGSGGVGETQSDFPVVIKAVGAGGTPFVSDLQIVNLSGSTANVTLQFFASSQTGQTTPTATATLTVAPGAQAVLNDVLASPLSQTSAIGSLRVLSDVPVNSFQRLFNDRRATNQGTNGFSFNGRPTAQAKSSGTLPFLSQASAADISARVGNRTNIGYFNPTTSAVSLTFSAFTSAGALLGTNTISVPGLSHVQGPAFSQISSVPDASRVQPDFYVTYQASAPIYVYAAVADNFTEDTVFVE